MRERPRLVPLLPRLPKNSASAKLDPYLIERRGG